MKVQNDFSRQVNILDVEKFNTPIHIIGGGATGSWLAFSLAKMGIENITVYDFDEVGMHNLPNQMFGLADIGRNKAISIKMLIRRFTGFNIKARNVKYESQTPLQGIVFVLTDTMKSRKDIFNRSIKNNPMIELLIETRMDLRGGRVYAFDPKDKEKCKIYENTLYSDDEAEVSACGVSQTVLPTALGIVSNAIWKMLNHINGEIYENETIMDFSNEIYFSSTWIKAKGKIVLTRELMLDKVFHCKTQELANKFAEICEREGLKWVSGGSLVGKTHWNNYYEETCYSITSKGDVYYGNKEYYIEEEGRDIIEFE